MNLATANPRRPSSGEFIILMALIISLVALSIDAMLPALPLIAADLGVQRINDSQYVISVFFAGMALGQIFFGPLSDSVGRRPAIISGFALFALGCLLSIFAVNFEQMLLGRLLQGVGAAGPRIVSIALVRDQFKGREMARVMSFVMMVFILVPVFAPALGQLVLVFADWRYIYVMFLLLVLILVPWFWIRQPETLAQVRRVRFSFTQLFLDISAIYRIRSSLGYTLAMGFIFGGFLGYLSSSQQIFQVQYQLHELFPLYFGILACAIGCASLFNASLVMRFGMRRLSNYAMNGICLVSIPFLLIVAMQDGHPPLYQLMAYLLPLFFCFGILFGNLNALAMEPLGHIAGLGSALIGSVSTLMSVVFGVFVAAAYDQTVVPLVAGFAVLGLAGLITMRWTEAEQVTAG
ncbi:MAG: multidrug effflux MFS transporter [Gammaproteobacteria bacterium]|jgi:DHA1 family bicyclomycin/chloramphenicol resistance-like MFS transporter|nr:multidrug effflux MFS transporter [Gammaproteobacteria bacterium]